MGCLYRIFCAGLFSVSLLFVSVSPAPGICTDTGSQKELRVAMEASDWGAFHFLSGDVYEGLEVDLARAAARELGVPCTVVPIPWGEGEPGSITGILEKGLWPDNVDCALSGIAILGKRSEKVLFSEPYFVAGQAVLLPREGGISFPEQMQGLHVAFQSGTTSALAAKDMEGLLPMPFETWGEVLEALLRGEAQAAIVDSPLAFQAMGNHEELTILDALLTREYYGMFFPKDTDPRLVETVNRVIEAESRKLQQRWIPFP